MGPGVQNKAGPGSEKPDLDPALKAKNTILALELCHIFSQTPAIFIRFPLSTEKFYQGEITELNRDGLDIRPIHIRCPDQI